MSDNSNYLHGHFVSTELANNEFSDDRHASYEHLKHGHSDTSGYTELKHTCLKCDQGIVATNQKDIGITLISEVTDWSERKNATKGGQSKFANENRESFLNTHAHKDDADNNVYMELQETERVDTEARRSSHFAGRLSRFEGSLMPTYSSEQPATKHGQQNETNSLDNHVYAEIAPTRTENITNMEETKPSCKKRLLCFIVFGILLFVIATTITLVLTVFKQAANTPLPAHPTANTPLPAHPSSGYNAACTTEGSSTQCKTTGAVCSTSNLCSCGNTQYYNAVQDTCLDKLIYNTSCPVEGSAIECKTSAADCLGGICLCPADKYYLAADDQCLVLIDFDGACTIADSDVECKTSAAMCTDNKCKCPVTMYHDTTNDECILQLAYNTSCPVEDSSTECKTSAASCMGGQCLCPSTMYYLFQDDQCLDLVDLDGTCTMADSGLECKTSSAVCRDMTCQCSVTMYYDTTEDACLLIDCGTPPYVTNGNIVSNGDTKYEGRATVTCDEGHTLVPDEPTLTCQTHDTWGDLPQCEAIACETFNFPNNSIDTSTDSSGQIIGKVFGDTIELECDSRYILLGGSSTQSCGTDGKWDVLTCESISITCTPLPVIENSVFLDVSDSSITVSCNEGYTLSGNEAIPCDSTSGSWSDSPSCTIVDCGPFANVSNGETIGTSTTYKSTITINCDYGYKETSESSDSLEITCQADATWSLNPTCTIKHCPTFTVSGNAFIESGGLNTMFGSVVTLSCVEGYETSDSHEVTCLADETWSPSPACIINNCPTFTSPNNASIVDGVGNTEYDSEITVACNDGYESDDSLLVKCQANAIWSPSPACTIKNCPTFTLPDNANIVDREGNTEYNSEITVTCNDGYDSDDSLLVKCQANAIWSPSPACTIKNCPIFTLPDNANIVDGAGNTVYNSEITVACNDGYDSDDSLLVKCQANATWSPSPACTITNCPTFTVPENANIVDGVGNTEYNSEITVACNDGYDSDDSLLVKCQANATWSPSPACTIKNCPTFTVLENANIVDGAGNTEYNSEITVACNDGYESDDSLLVKCQADKTWSTSPTCAIRFCPTFTVPDNAVIESGQDNLEFNSEITVACIAGYETQNVVVVTCQADKTWSASPMCVITNCPTFTVPDNANIVDGDGNTEFNSEITVVCNDGYDSDDLVVKCQADKTWSASPKCTIRYCLTFTVPDNAKIESGQGTIEFDSEITVACNEGYETEDALVVTCQANKTWSASPVCTIKNCPLFTLPDNAKIVDVAGNTKYNSEITVACNYGYDSDNLLLVKCQANATWSPSPACTIKSCPLFTLPDNAKIVDGAGNTEYNSEITVACNYGYDSVDLLFVKCQANATWSPSPVCTITNCLTFTVPENANIVDGAGNTEYNSEIPVACNDGYESEDILIVKCQANATWSPSPACTIANCPLFTLPDNAKIVDGAGNTEYNSEITVACNYGYDSVDLLFVKCQANRTWSPSPVCTITNCLTFTVPENANIVDGAGNTEYNSEITVACNDGYESEDSLLVKCQANATWSPSPACTITNCPTFTVPENANIVDGVGNTEYNSEITVACNDGYNSDDSLLVKCQANATWSPSPVCTIKNSRG